MGGGIGKTQGLFGLMLDNVIDATVVLADGKTITVSETSHPDLFWGLRGAGHNFGIVTQLTYKVHDLVPANGRWYVVSLSFQGKKLEQVFDLYQQFTGSESNARLALVMQIVIDPELSTTEVSSSCYTGPYGC